MSRLRRALHRGAKIAAAAALVSLTGCGSGHIPGLDSLSDLRDKDRSMLRVADASREAGDCAAAIRFYRLAVDKSGKPDEIAAARLGAAGCELATGALAEAERDYRAAIAATPANPASYVGLGRIHLLQHRPGEALGYFDLAAKKGGTDTPVWIGRGVALDQLRRHKEAQAAYRAGLALYPSDHALRNNLALSLAFTGDFAEAEDMLRALAAEPDATARTRQNLALALGLAGDKEDARRVAEADLDDAALQNNSRYYDFARGLIAHAPQATPAPATKAQIPAPPLAAPTLPVHAAALPPTAARAMKATGQKTSATKAIAIAAAAAHGRPAAHDRRHAEKSRHASHRQKNSRHAAKHGHSSGRTANRHKPHEGPRKAVVHGPHAPRTIVRAQS